MGGTSYPQCRKELRLIRHGGQGLRRVIGRASSATARVRTRALSFATGARWEPSAGLQWHRTRVACRLERVGCQRDLVVDEHCRQCTCRAAGSAPGSVRWRRALRSIAPEDPRCVSLLATRRETLVCHPRQVAWSWIARSARCLAIRGKQMGGDAGFVQKHEVGASQVVRRRCSRDPLRNATSPIGSEGGPWFLTVRHDAPARRSRTSRHHSAWRGRSFRAWRGPGAPQSRGLRCRNGFK